MAAHVQTAEAVIEVRNVRTQFGNAVIHEDVSLTINRGEIFALVGASGGGKSTLLREMILLQRPAAGSIRVLGQDVLALAPGEALRLRRRWGVMFQRGALFSALSVAENVSAPLQEHSALSVAVRAEIAALKIALVGLPADTGAKYPAEISGGMLKRVALARAFALDPELLFLDEPTAGLDPMSAEGIDELVQRLKDMLGLTVILVTHDLDTLWRIVDRVAVLGEGRVLGVGSMQELAAADHPLIREYFDGPRGRGAKEHAWTQK